jgi:hypothetical protein
MATNTVNGVLVCSDGTNIPLKAELAEGTESDLTTDTTYTVSAQNIGDYAQGKTVTPFTLQAGDKLRVMNNTAADREAALCVYTASGVSRIFVVTPTGGATNELVDLQTSNSIGDTLQGQTVVKAFCTSVDTNKIETPGAVVVDALGNVVGSVPMTSPGLMQPLFNSYRIPVNLNFKAQFLTNA